MRSWWMPSSGPRRLPSNGIASWRRRGLRGKRWWSAARATTLTRFMPISPHVSQGGSQRDRSPSRGGADLFRTGARRSRTTRGFPGRRRSGGSIPDHRFDRRGRSNPQTTPDDGSPGRAWPERVGDLPRSDGVSGFVQYRAGSGGDSDSRDPASAGSQLFATRSGLSRQSGVAGANPSPSRRGCPGRPLRSCSRPSEFAGTMAVESARFCQGAWCPW